jgi:hypothetical protein
VHLRSLSMCLVAILVTLSLGACDPTDDVGRRLGLWKQDGELRFEYLSCPDDEIKRVELRAIDGGATRILWLIEANESEGAHGRFSVGTRPEGFTELVPLTDELLPGQTYGLSVDSSRQRIAGNTFMLGELRESEVLTSFADEYVTPSEFRARAPSSC